MKLGEKSSSKLLPLFSLGLECLCYPRIGMISKVVDDAVWFPDSKLYQNGTKARISRNDASYPYLYAQAEDLWYGKFIQELIPEAKAYGINTVYNGKRAQAAKLSLLSSTAPMSLSAASLLILRKDRLSASR